jgi:ABC-type dipeptide/oligopeptide/nickel transport system permease subunit
MTALSMSTAQLAYAALSFLGFGARPPQADFGSMLSNDRNFMTFDVWVVLCPGLALVFLIVAFNLFGDAIRDALDPHVRSEMT